MHIQLTDAAAARLQTLADSPDAVYKLVYDTEGCGCAVSGVPTLWLLDGAEAAESQVAAASDPTITYDPQQAVFFEDQLRLDYNSSRNSLILSSSGQIYTHDLAVIDKRIS